MYIVFAWTDAGDSHHQQNATLQLRRVVEVVDVGSSEGLACEAAAPTQQGTEVITVSVSSEDIRWCTKYSHHSTCQE